VEELDELVEVVAEAVELVESGEVDAGDRRTANPVAKENEPREIGERDLLTCGLRLEDGVLLGRHPNREPVSAGSARPLHRAALGRVEIEALPALDEESKPLPKPPRFTCEPRFSGG
jgi:hypothetical protein